MDIFSRVHLWIFYFVIFIFLMNCELSRSTQGCPQRQVQHAGKDGYKYCCFPTRCGVGYHVKTCEKNGTHDTCVQCAQHQNQSRRTSSFRPDKCVHWPLDSNCKKDNRLDLTDQRTKQCLCNVEHGLMFDEPESYNPNAPTDAYCQNMDKPCPPGMEPTVSGKCKACDQYYFSNATNFQLCDPITDCSQLSLKFLRRYNATSDSVCETPAPPQKVSLPPTTTTTTPAPTKRPVTTARPITTHGIAEPPVGPSTAQQSSDGGNDAAMPVIIVVVVIVCLAIIIFVAILIYRKKRGHSFCDFWCCAPEKSIHNSMQLVPTQVNPSSKPPHSLPNGIVHHHHHESDQPGKAINNNGGLHIAPSYTTTINTNGLTYPQVGSTYQDTVRSHLVQAQTNPRHTPKQGILRNGSAGVNHASYPTHPGATREISMDSIAREKLRVKVVSNDSGEEEPLLPENPGSASSSAGGSELGFHGVAYSPSPPIASAPQMFIPPPVPAMMSQYKSGYNTTPSVRPKVSFEDKQGAVTFTRSTSVITNPEGEREEEELEAKVPRFSQLLPHDDSDLSHPDPQARPNPILQMLQERENPRAMSPAREPTTELRNPKDRLFFRPHTDSPLRVFGDRRVPESNPRPALNRGISAPNDEEHRIMDLKEQQLAESRSASLDESSLNTRLTPSLDSSLNTRLKVPDDSSTQPTNCNNSKKVRTDCNGADYSEETKVKKHTNVNSSSRLKPSEFSGVQKEKLAKEAIDNSDVRDKLNTGSDSDLGSDISAKKPSSERDTNVKAYSEELTDSLAAIDNNISPIDDEEDSVVLADERSTRVKEPLSVEVIPQTADPKCVLNDTSSASPGSDNGSSSSTTADSTSRYVRSQSESVSGDNNQHKPPTRSASSEDKQKNDRPIATVKPMPASSLSINKESDSSGQITALRSANEYSDEDSEEESHGSPESESREIESNEETEQTTRTQESNPDASPDTQNT